MKPNIKVSVNSVTIRETGLGWLNKHTGRYYKTAIGAQRAIKRDAARRVTADGALVTMVNWETTSVIGTAIVKAIS